MDEPTECRFIVEESIRAAIFRGMHRAVKKEAGRHTW